MERATKQIKVHNRIQGFISKEKKIVYEKAAVYDFKENDFWLNKCILEYWLLARNWIRESPLTDV